MRDICLFVVMIFSIPQPGFLRKQVMGPIVPSDALQNKTGEELLWG